jgi:autotransporter-associated beta strand protein
MRPTPHSSSSPHRANRRSGSSPLPAVFAGILVLAGSGSARAASGSWSADADGTWATPGNWTGSVVADGAASTATFANNITAIRTVTLAVDRTIGGLSFGDADNLGSPGGWIFSGGTLTLDNGATAPLISVAAMNGPTGFVDATNDVVVGSILTSSQGFVKKGPGTLTLMGANSFGASVRLDEGIVAIGNAAALGSGNRGVVYNGGGVQVWGGGPAFANTNIVQTTGSMISSNGNFDAWNGPWTGSGTMQIHSTGRLTPGGGSSTAMAGFTGTIDLSDSTSGNNTRINLGNNALYDLSAITLNCGSDGGRFSFRIGFAPSVVKIGALLGTGTGTRLASSEQSAGTQLTWEIGYLNTSTAFAGNIQDYASGRTGHLTKVGTGKLTLTGNSAYTGITTISNGTLALAGGGNLAGTPSITVLSGATFDVSARDTELSLDMTKTLAGGGAVVGNVSVVGGTVSPGPGIATLTFNGNLTLGGLATNRFRIGHSSNGALQINGDLSVTDPVLFSVVPTGPVIGNGSYVLAKWTGAFNGDTASVQLESLPQTGTIGLVVDTAAKEIRLEVSGVAGAANLVWKGDGTANAWDLTTPNWLVGAVASIFNTGDNVTFDTSGNNAAPVDLALAVGPARVTVNATKDYVFTSSTTLGKISGSGGLVKTNTGKLTLLVDNDFTGPTDIRAGTVVVGDVASLSGTISAGVVTNNGRLVYNRVDETTVPNAIHGTGQVVQAGFGTLTLAGANTFSGGLVVSNGIATVSTVAGLGTGPLILGGGTFAPGGITITNALSLVANSTVNVTGGEPQFVANNITGTGGTLTLSGAQVRFSGSGFDFARPIANELTALRSYNNTGVQTFSGVISGAGAYQRRWSDGTPGNDGSTIFSGANTFSGGTLLREGGIGFGVSSVSTTPGVVVSGPIGTGALNQDTATYTAVFASGGARTLHNPIMLNAGGQAFIINGSFDLTLAGTVDLGGGIKDIRVDNTAMTIISGDISNGTLSKTGPGALLVNGNNNAAANTVAAGTLGGTGTFNGGVTVQSGGALAPGVAIGTLTVNSTLALEAGSTTRMEVDKGNGTRDLVTGLASVTYGGTLEISNLSGTLAAGDAFKLFSATSYSGAFAAISPAAPGAGLAWDTSTLATDGTLRIKTGTAVSTPGISSVTKVGGNLVFSGTNGTPGGTYSVLTSTDVATPVASWSVGSSGTFDGTGRFNATNTVDAGTPQRFFLLRAP